MVNGKYFRTEEIRLKNSLGNLGKSSKLKGRFIGKPNYKNRGNLNASTRPDVRLKISQALKGKSRSLESRKLQSESIKKSYQSGIRIPYWKNKSHSLGFREKQRDLHLGSKSYLWRGGITPLNKLIRKSLEYKIWRKSVFERDDYTCQNCGKHGGYLQADHIKPFALYPELRFDLNNGRTLCVECHRKTDTWGKRILKYNRQDI